ncbi:MAG: glycosyltransferase family 9 protein [Planctomycetota bacterium]
MRLSALGDVIQVLPALEALAQQFPAAKIDVVTETLSSALLEGHPRIHRVIELPRSAIRSCWKTPERRGQSWPLFENFVRQLRRENYDLLVDWQSNLRSALVRIIARSQRVLGIHPADGGELPGWWPGYRPASAASAVNKIHRVERALHVVKELGWQGSPPSGQLGSFDSIHIEGDHGPNSPVLLHPFVSSFGRFKEWSISRWAQLARSLAKQGLPIWISGGPDDQDGIASIVKMSGYAAAPAPRTRGLPELTALIDRCRAVVAADTGILHLAAIRHLPAIGLYGPKDPAVHGPWGDSARVIASQIDCSPCNLRSCEHSFCMQSISPESVAQELLELLANDHRHVDPTP